MTLDTELQCLQLQQAHEQYEYIMIDFHVYQNVIIKVNSASPVCIPQAF